MALPVMSPPMIRTSALWNAPAFRNLRQHTSDPWMSVAKKILIGCAAWRCAASVVAHFLGLDVPLLPFADRRAQLPAGRLLSRVDGRAQGGDLRARIEPHRALTADVHVLRDEVGVEVLLQLVEV